MTTTVTGQYIYRNPDIVRWDGLLTPAECDELIALAKPHLGRSATFSGVADSRRTSSSAFALSGGVDRFWSSPVMQRLVERCAMISGYPLSHVEPVQVTAYQPGEFFMAHFDNYPAENPSLAASGQRDYTFYLYLSEPPADSETSGGGETAFPQLQTVQGTRFTVTPRRGSAIFWRNIDIASGADDVRMLHSGEAPVGWTKYGANIWIRHKPWIG